MGRKEFGEQRPYFRLRWSELFCFEKHTSAPWDPEEIILALSGRSG